MMARRISAATATAIAVALVSLAAARGAAQEEKPEFVGDKACQKCHYQEHKSWKKTKLAQSLKSLGPTAEADNKALFDRKKTAGLDPAKDYSADEKCVKCHVTGWGEPSGYPKDPKASEDAGKKAAALGSVGCEACHGAGSVYVKHKTAEIEKDKDAKFTFEGMAKLGLRKPDEALCKTCHNADNPMKEDFNFEEAKAKSHDHPKPKEPAAPKEPK